jgi:hypothetical protein
VTPLRVDLDPDDVGRGFTALVLALAEAVRELLERQAVRRIEAGDLSPEKVERLGSTLLAVRQQLIALREQLEIESDRKDTS